MMDGIATIQRACPSCGETAGRREIASNPPAETLPESALGQSWAGLGRGKAFFTYLRCDGCNLLYNPRYFSRGTLARLYADLEPNMDMIPPAMIAATQRGYFDTVAAASPLPGEHPAGDYLEIGPDVGHMTREAVQRGAFRHFWLYEPNQAVHDSLRAATAPHPFSISDEMEDLSQVPDGSVALAVMVHVLDHLIEPLAMTRQIARKLRPGGMLAIVTHNEASLLRRAIGTLWPPFCLQHPQLFSPETMRGLLGRSGFGEIDVIPCSNVFPTDFLLRQAGQLAGLQLDRMPLPAIALRLRLGNILTLARMPG